MTRRCAPRAIGPEIEIIDIQHMNDLHKKVEDGDVRLRYLIDVAP